ncbi:MAG: hydroxyacylglutathione hydrolase [Polyangiaceae bacterium]|nr:hydroxyacylglutathione hydrolase [Polyangiaceae bacterium]
MKIEIIPCLADNYAYIAIDECTAGAVILDPSDGPPVLDRINEIGVKPSAILCTHHHSDHVGGVSEIARAFPGIEVWAHSHAMERIPGANRSVAHGDKVAVRGLELCALYVPGHTMGDVAWRMGDYVFTGDTLFAGGCGRVFEGTSAMMYDSIRSHIASLPVSTKIYCGHQYTVSNLRFAEHVEPSNKLIGERRAQVEAELADEKIPEPSTIETELLTNPFLRCDHPEVVQFAVRRGAIGPDPASVFASIREAKNQFRG